MHLQTQLRDLAAGFARVLPLMSRLLRSEGAGNAGRLMRPQPRVRNKTKHTSVVTTVTPEISRHSPRNGFTAYSALSPATNSSCHRRWRIKGSSNPVGLDFASASLTPATGARTTRLCRPLKRRSSRTPQTAHEVHLALRLPCAPDALASTASRPAFVTTRDPPLLSERDGHGYRSDLGQAGTEIFFKMGLDRPVTKQPVGQISWPVRRSWKSEGGKASRTSQSM